MTSTRNTVKQPKHKNNAKGALFFRTECPHCHKPLRRRTVELFGRSVEVTDYASCGCEESKWDGENIDRTDRKYAAAGIPMRYISADADLMGWDDEIMRGGSLYIHGPFGTGKTRFACALAKRLIDRGVSARFENAGHLMAEIKAMYGGRSSDAMERAYACRVLVLDDLGKEQPTPHSMAMLYELIDSRYMAGKPIIVTSNFDRSELMRRWAQADEATAESMVSRLCDGTECLFMGGDDRRLA